MSKDAEMKAKVWTIQSYNEENPEVFANIDIRDTKKGFFLFPFRKSVIYCLQYQYVEIWINIFLFDFEISTSEPQAYLNIHRPL